MPKEVDIILSKMPPPGKKGGGDSEPDPGDTSGDDYNPEEDAAMGVAKALGIPEDQVDVQALCSALRDFNATSKGPIEEE